MKRIFLLLSVKLLAAMLLCQSYIIHFSAWGTDSSDERNKLSIASSNEQQHDLSTDKPAAFFYPDERAFR